MLYFVLSIKRNLIKLLRSIGFAKRKPQGGKAKTWRLHWYIWLKKAKRHKTLSRKLKLVRKSILRLRKFIKNIRKKKNYREKISRSIRLVTRLATSVRHDIFSLLARRDLARLIGKKLLYLVYKIYITRVPKRHALAIRRLTAITLILLLLAEISPIGLQYSLTSTNRQTQAKELDFILSEKENYIFEHKKNNFSAYFGDKNDQSKHRFAFETAGKTIELSLMQPESSSLAPAKVDVSPAQSPKTSLFPFSIK